MEDVYTIKVKTKPDTRNLYPSERRYSASTVSGLAWVHIALAATSFLLACLALVNPNSDIKRINLDDTENTLINRSDVIFDLNIEEFDRNLTGLFNEVDTNNTDEHVASKEKRDSNYILVLAPSLLTIFALAAGIASIMASVRWYIDRNITWLFIMSIFSTIFSLISCVMIFVWFFTNEVDISESYKEKIPSNDYFVVKHSDVIERNDSHMIIKTTPFESGDNSHLFTKRVLSINIFIASFLEFLWSILSVKIAYKGMRNNYKEDDNERRGNCISVVTTIKGNNTKKLPRNGKLLPPKPDLIQHYPSTKIKRIFLAQSDNGFYLKNQSNKARNTETSSELYKERMMNFLNRCASLEGMSNPEMQTPSVQSENVLNPIPEVVTAEINIPEKIEESRENSRVTPVSWGDTPEHTIYNQNTINFEKIFNFHNINNPQEIEKEVENNDNKKVEAEVTENDEERS
ncbi:uncharacterized protein LOC113238722 [Hyposmocoma kahamanoa]|uniref:uncharacterized protein LOC113238722 n=1 Tax=Hyposmocoma kahamanoa TaxID=1477025 RepID=UPI000E6D82D7|nr:uncharacterized protein LOC113238722 [Hyposmocoma kahamanoa]